MATTTNLNTLVINYLTEAQYEAEVSGGTVDPDALYLTPDSGGGSGVSDVEVDGVSVVTGGVAEIDLTGKSDVGHTHTKSAITDFPTIPTITDTYSGTSSDGMSGKAVKSAIDALDGTVSGSAGSGKTLTAFSQTDGKVSATFGNISITKSQISDFPTIPTVNNATLTIQKNGTTVDTFTANASSNVTANITVPTDTGDLTNGAGFVTASSESLATGITIYRIGSLRILDFNGATGSTISGLTLASEDRPSEDIRGVAFRRDSNASGSQLGMLVLRYSTGKVDAYRASTYGSSVTAIGTTDTEIGQLIWSV